MTTFLSIPIALFFLIFGACNFIAPNEPSIPETIKQSTSEIALSSTEDIPDSFIFPFEINSLSQDQPRAFLSTFHHHVQVFGIDIFATENVPSDKLIHAANVMAEYLDNDEDGIPDNPLVVEKMLASQATLVIFANANEEDSSEFFELNFPESMALQNLYADETHPKNSLTSEFDFTLEEVLHLITHSGYAPAYHNDWGEYPGTKVAIAMDLARGAFFENTPSSYPSDAWYCYDDPTCNYSCQITEYTYWSLTSLLGAQDGADRFEEIENEWLLNSPDKIRAGDPAIVELLSNPIFNFPTRIPDGNYEP
jgi:hypothetical protein